MEISQPPPGSDFWNFDCNICSLDYKFEDWVAIELFGDVNVMNSQPPLESDFALQHLFGFSSMCVFSFSMLISQPFPGQAALMAKVAVSE